MRKPRVVRRATWRKFRVLVTTANGLQLLEHVDQPNVYWARNCSDFPWTVEDVPLLHIRAAGRAVPLHVAWGRDTANVDSFLLELEVPSGGVVAIGWRSLCVGFRSSSRTRDGLRQAPTVAVVRLVHDHVYGAVRQCYGFVQGSLR